MFLKFLLLLFVVELLSAKTLELQKAEIYHDQNISGWFMSEKLDGIRGYWNGKEMLSKKGYKINTPKYFTQNFPPFELDGELWIERGLFEDVQSIVMDSRPSKEWKKITYNIFEVPNANGNFIERLKRAKDWFNLHPNRYVNFINQLLCNDVEELKQFLQEIDSKGGEGVIVKNPNMKYFTGRSSHILKVKKFRDMEGEVISINRGAGKYQNMMGSLTIKLENGVVFRLGNGFKIEERENPPQIGQIVTFKYFGFTKKKKPKFASFMRIRDTKN